MQESYSLPSDLQVAVAIASMISSLGVIIAFWQVILSNRRYKAQLQLSADQYKIQNQGYLAVDSIVGLARRGVPASLAMVADAKYNQLVCRLRYRNVGKTPIIVKLKDAKLFEDELPTCYLEHNRYVPITLYPGDTDEEKVFAFMLPDLGQTFTEVQSRHFSFEYKIEYNDFNDSHIKMNYRKQTIEVNEFNVSGMYQHVKDQIFVSASD